MSEKKSHLTLYICIAIVAAVGLALLAPHFAMKFHIGLTRSHDDGRAFGGDQRHSRTGRRS